MGKRITVIIILVIFLCSFFVTPVYADVLPGYFDPTLPLNGEMLQSIYYSFLNLLGLRGTITNNTIAYNRNSYYFTNDQLSEFVLEQSVIDNWNRIKNYFVQDGNITYSDGRTVPRWKLEITSDNVNDIKLFAKDIQDKQMALYNYNMAQDYTWTDISHVYGGYLSYASQFIGCLTFTRCPNNYTSYQPCGIDHPIQTSGGSKYYYSPIGMDLYMRIIGSDSISPIIQFSSDNDTFVFLNKPAYAYIVGVNYFGSTAVGFDYYIAFPVSIDSSSISISLSSRNTNINGSSAPYIYWERINLLSANGYSSWINEMSSSYTDNDINQYTLGSVTYTSPGTLQINVSGSTVYFVAKLHIAASSGRALLKNTNYQIQNQFDILINDNTQFGVWNVNGVPRGYGWSVDITDSGTGTVTTIPNAISTVEDSVFDVGSVLYFPGAVTNVPEMVEILNGDMVLTGEAAGTIDPDNPSNPNNESVSIDIVPPASLGLASIWHYVSDTATYCASFISVLVGNIFTIIPTPIFNIAFAAVVLGILFGLYKRFIE